MEHVYQVTCEAGSHVQCFDARGLEERFGRYRAHELIQDPEYPLKLDPCEECIQDGAARRGGLVYLRTRYGLPP